jgi:hypothetical protein
MFERYPFTLSGDGGIEEDIFQVKIEGLSQFNRGKVTSYENEEEIKSTIKITVMRPMISAGAAGVPILHTIVKMKRRSILYSFMYSFSS